MISRRRVFGLVPPTGKCVREDRCQTPLKNFRTIALRPPIDLLYSAAAFEAAGCECRLADLPAEERGWDAVERELASFRPSTVVLSVTTPTLPEDARAAALAKRLDPRVLTIAKGAHFNTLDVDSLQRYPELDVVLRGEIEETCIELGRGRPLAEVAGITWRDAEGRIVRNPDRAFTRDLDRLPFPARHLLRNDLYRRPDTGEPQTTIVTNRGCPYHCVYCLANQTAGTANRYRSVDNVLSEIAECVERHGIRSFLFRSDLFTQNQEWVIRLCQSIVEAGLRIEWACNSRVDCLSPELLSWMRRAGCWIIAFGVESGDQATLDRLAKRARVEDSFRAIRLCREAGIRSSIYLLMGLPWDTRESIGELSEFAKRLDPDILEIFYAYPFPGTPLYRTCVEYGLLRDGEIPPQAYDSPAFPGLHLSIAEMSGLRTKALRAFYLRPGKILRTLRSARSAAQLRGYFRTGLSQLKDFALAG
jgi:radical SAM superfamily enzyme YgiQ (UPF0313 family)